MSQRSVNYYHMIHDPMQGDVFVQINREDDDPDECGGKILLGSVVGFAPDADPAGDLSVGDVWQGSPCDVVPSGANPYPDPQFLIDMMLEILPVGRVFRIAHMAYQISQAYTGWVYSGREFGDVRRGQSFLHKKESECVRYPWRISQGSGESYLLDRIVTLTDQIQRSSRTERLQEQLHDERLDRRFEMQQKLLEHYIIVDKTR